MSSETLEHSRMSTDEIIESIMAICAPLPECRALRDRIVAELEDRHVDQDFREALEKLASWPTNWQNDKYIAPLRDYARGALELGG